MGHLTVLIKSEVAAKSSNHAVLATHKCHEVIAKHAIHGNKPRGLLKFAKDKKPSAQRYVCVFHPHLVDQTQDETISP